jgi:hypothetical protein
VMESACWVTHWASREMTTCCFLLALTCDRETQIPRASRALVFVWGLALGVWGFQPLADLGVGS